MSNLIDKLGIRRLLNLGVTEELSLDSSVRVQLSNLVSVLGIFSNIQYSIFFVIAGAPHYQFMNVIHVMVISLLVFVLYLNTKEKYFLARIILVFTISVPLFFVSTVSFGTSGGFYYYFLMFAIVPFVIFPYEEKWLILFVFLMNTVFYLWFEFFGSPGIFAEGTLLYHKEVRDLFRINSVVSCLSFVALFMFYFLRNINRIQKEMIRINDHKDRIFSILAHDLKGPIGTMSTFLGYLTTSLPEREELIFALKELKKSTNQTYLVLENLLDWVRNETKKTQCNPNKLSLSVMIQNAVEILNMQAAEKGIHIETKIADEYLVFCDERMTATVLRNILSNAIKYSHPNGTVVIDVEPIFPFIEISFEDNGVGMTEDLLGKILEGKRFTSRFGTVGEKGTGLGLLVCMELLKEQGGSLQVTSKPKEGTKITIKLPLIN
ncbi:HAMP domain-containing histidine kinase [Leptospira sp. 2 VSF19]|uniref:histidine kinase n=1 Tax=Leptospira soteropolitanensis TaxID=2950025 RepID=A0AAW5VFB0_9LEPT|nr:HAMP domain-containing sensor histidine kinase [Leptospira soteropolitanensis]MCW7493616.1 HAMP domain-containing histidine kinase [Leptospira soteropolitanensis]MCW7501215.1 HAMP domain-containing histidine kinase [Leptospira soteropolitanensis]MCW7523599.1 HAMP domain-containing histidine kinase [Leptospira soteropolitanensis]MCW7527328.1 HAMP domain-containing histidine kinase [Leptospira soteropolitanensis]MCW7531185.1 HAMP domain-containing histidine kinase [Leptospira soteropolitanens